MNLVRAGNYIYNLDNVIEYEWVPELEQLTLVYQGVIPTPQKQVDDGRPFLSRSCAFVRGENAKLLWKWLDKTSTKLDIEWKV